MLFFYHMVFQDFYISGSEEIPAAVLIENSSLQIPAQVQQIIEQPENKPQPKKSNREGFTLMAGNINNFKG